MQNTKKFKLGRIRKYLIFTKAAFMEFFAYRAAVLLWSIPFLMETGLFTMLWLAVFRISGQEVINGFTLPIMLTFVFTSRLTARIVYSSDSFYVLADDIRMGNIANSLIKPISYRGQLVFKSFGYYGMGCVMQTIPFMIVGFIGLHFWMDAAVPMPQYFLLYFFSTLLSLLVLDSFDFIFGSLATFTGAMFGLMQVKNGIMMFLSGALLPLAFFPMWAQNILKFTPFPSMVDVPNRILLGMMDTKQMLISVGIQAAWAIGLYLLSLFVFSRIKKHVISVGG